MGRTACTEPQCLYKGALYLTSGPVQGCALPYLIKFIEEASCTITTIVPWTDLILTIIIVLLIVLKSIPLSFTMHNKTVLTLVFTTAYS